ncbi:hypothetical protein DERP_002028 [Dermatophagoides pteronyssinus]|uniref:Uncharacterized protein n=1 Tax=Dermatophagoides pteronyssinus TaxID=6956 RepID=A0ABQ8JGK2_DERPT|nr:hypothetical protein DERP_002028 [Dermatophagoides pteronyssinus]
MSQYAQTNTSLINLIAKIHTIKSSKSLKFILQELINFNHLVANSAPMANIESDEQSKLGTKRRSDFSGLRPATAQFCACVSNSLPLPQLCRQATQE